MYLNDNYARAMRRVISQGLGRVTNMIVGTMRLARNLVLPAGFNLEEGAPSASIMTMEPKDILDLESPTDREHREFLATRKRYAVHLALAYCV